MRHLAGTNYDCYWIDQKGCCRQCEDCEWYTPVEEDLEESEYQEWLVKRKNIYTDVVSDFQEEAGV